MDSVSCWHWFKHNIVESWRVGNNVIRSSVERRDTLDFQIIVRPPRENTINYWLNQTRKPIFKVFVEESASQIVEKKWGVDLRISMPYERSNENYMGPKWDEIEQKAFTGNKKIILLIDDEMRKLYDLLHPLRDNYTIIFAQNAKDGLEKINVTNVDLAIVDMQIGSGGLWSKDETDCFKLTGMLLAKEILRISPDTRVGILTGTRHDCKESRELPLVFFEKKPIIPERFEEMINDILSD